MTRRFGVHCSIRRGLDSALNETLRLGCNTLQIFTRSPLLWQEGRPDPEEALAFHRRRRENNIDPVIVHTPYLPNLCTSQERMYGRSYAALVQDLHDCRELEAAYLVIHPGSFSDGKTPTLGIARLTDAINRALTEVPGEVMILIENMAGGGRRLGGSFEEISAMLHGITDSKRIGLCLDTAHTLAAGYPIHEESGLEQTLERLRGTIGLERLRVIHVNDSRAALGTHRDLHEHLGDGVIGEAGLGRILRHPALNHAALILETPKHSPLDDERNIRTLRRLLT